MIQTGQKFKRPIPGMGETYEHNEYTYGYKGKKEFPWMECGFNGEEDGWTCLLHDGSPSGQNHTSIDGFSIDPSIVSWIESDDSSVKFSFGKPFACSDDADPGFENRVLSCVAAKNIVDPASR